MLKDMLLFFLELIQDFPDTDMGSSAKDMEDILIRLAVREGRKSLGKDVCENFHEEEQAEYREREYGEKDCEQNSEQNCKNT